jgi:hypothetical protein
MLESQKEISAMHPSGFVTPELIKEIEVPERGILSRTLYEDSDVKVVLFGFSPGRRQMAARADRGRTLPRSHGHFDTLLVGTEVGALVDKTSKTMAAV